MEKKNQFTQEQKYIILGSAGKIGIKEAAKVAGIHYTTVYEWRNRLEALGKEVFLAYKSPARGRGVKKITEAREKAILDTWKRYPGFGPSQIRNQLRRQGMAISTRTVCRLMEANGYKGPRKKQKQEATRRFEAARPLELAQIDILEFFINKLKVYLIILMDDFSRFILGARLFDETSVDTVIDVVMKALDRYGKMEELLSDRGFVFYSWRGINRFEKFLETEGIHHTHARPHHPQTLGKVEAVNKQIQKELISRERFDSTTGGEAAILRWVDTYNYRRTHQGLGGLLVPADRFHGRSENILKSITDGIDPDTDLCYSSEGIPRSIINLVLDPDGKMKLHVLGRNVTFTGVNDG